MAGHINIFTDGGSRGNPGPAAAAYLIFDSDQKLLERGGQFLGVKTNNEAEYQGILLALQALSKFALSPQTAITFYSDSQLIVNQLKGVYKIKEPRLAALAADIHSILHSLFIIPVFVSIPRKQNFQADTEVNFYLDQALASSL